MNPTSKIYVAGHRGLVGSALMRALAAKGYTNLITRTHAELDLADQSAVRDFFAREKPEYVLLAAAKVGGIHANNTYPAEFIHENLAIQTNVIHEAWRNGVKRLLFLGSSCIYPRDCPQPIKEEYLLTGPLEPTNRPYALAKIAGIEMCHAYNRQYGTRYMAVMPTNLYGPNDNYDLNNSHVLPAMIRKFHLAKLAKEGNWQAIEEDEARNGTIPADLKQSLHSHVSALSTQHSALDSQSSALSPQHSAHDSQPSAHGTQHSALDSQSSVLSTQHSVVIWGTGTPRREFLYSDDMAEACLYLLEQAEEKLKGMFNDEVPPLVNVGCGEDLTIRELAELVRDIVGFAGNVTFDTSKPDGTMRKLLDVNKLKKMGWQATTGLRDGITSAYKSYLEGLA